MIFVSAKSSVDSGWFIHSGQIQHPAPIQNQYGWIIRSGQISNQVVNLQISTSSADSKSIWMDYPFEPNFKSSRESANCNIQP
jgi:hypothetical protein